MGGQFCSGKYRMPAEERFMFHDGVGFLSRSQVLLWDKRSIVNQLI